jgi:SSS family solute:Na+ symporter
MYCLVYAMAGALIGTAGRVFLPHLADADSAFANIVNVVLPAGLRGLVLAASLAAMMSTASACLLAASTVLLEDVYLRLRGSASIGSVFQSRMVTLAFGVAMTVVASSTTDVIAAITVAYDLLVGALFVPVIGAMVWRRGTGAGAIASIAVGGPTVILLLVLRGVDSDAPIYAGFGMSLAVYIVTSLLTRPGTAAIHAAGNAEMGVES